MPSIILLWTVCVTDLIKPSNSLPSDILANGDIKTVPIATDGSENMTTQNNTASEVVQNSPTTNNNVSVEYGCSMGNHCC